MIATPRKYFKIQAGDVGSEAYDDGYVAHLERELADLRRRGRIR